MQHRAGFTLVEVMVAIVLLGVGILALVSTFAQVTRMIGRGRMTAQAAEVALARLEVLRQQALADSVPCGGLAGGTAVAPYGMSETWTVTAIAGIPSLRMLTASVSYPITTGARQARLITMLRCP